MYRIPLDEDWAFLFGHVVEQVCIGSYDVQLHLSGNTTISIQGELAANAFQHDTLAGSPAGTDLPHAATGLVSLLGATIMRVEAHDPQTLLIHFDNDETLHLFDTSDHYECFTISAPNRSIIV